MVVSGWSSLEVWICNSVVGASAHGSALWYSKTCPGSEDDCPVRQDDIGFSDKRHEKGVPRPERRWPFRGIWCLAPSRI